MIRPIPAAAVICAVAAVTTACGAQTPFDGAKTASLASSKVMVPLTREGVFYFATVRVNGKPFKFTLETGANFVAVSSATARALGLKLDSVDVQGAGGQTLRSQGVAIDSISIGGAKLTKLVARVMPEWDAIGFDGIVSLPLLRDFLATIDLPQSRLILEQGSLPAPNGRDIVALAGLDRAERADVPMTFAGVTVPVVIDTRSFIGIALPDSLESRLRFSSSPVSTGQAAGPALGTFQMRGAQLAGDAQIGSALVQRPPLTLRSRGGPVIGVPLLEQLEITLDLRNKRARVRQPNGKVIQLSPSQPQQRVAVAPSPAPSGSQPTMGFNMAGFPGTNQLQLVNVVPGSDAEKVGLKNGDMLVEFDGVATSAMNPGIFRAAIARGTPVKVVVTRDGKRLEFNVRPYSPQ